MENSISVEQARYATPIFKKYLDTVTIRENSNCHKTTLTHDMILSKEYSFASYE